MRLVDGRGRALVRVLAMAMAVVVALAAGTGAATAAEARPRPGTLDRSFGRDGVVRTDVVPGVSDGVSAVAVQPDGKVVVAGQSWDDAGGYVTLVRYHADGGLDRGFGADGRVATPGGWYGVSDMAVQADGSILVAGGFGIDRYRADGRRDASFGDGGRVPLSPATMEVIDVAPLPDGRVVATTLTTDALGYDVFTLERYRRDGRLDTSFGEGGRVQTAFPGYWGSANALAVLPDGRLVLAGTLHNVAPDVGLARYLPDGELDTTFGVDGTTTTDLGGGDNVRALAVRTDGTLVVSGVSYAPDAHVFVASYRRDGTADTRLGGTGWVVQGPVTGGGFGDEAPGLTLSPDGRPVVSAYPNGGPDADVTLLRFRRDGRLDAGFGDGGVARVDLGGNDIAVALATQRDGKVLAATVAWTGDTAEVAVARFHG
jgi:uncharacterized delta-60 repeat protein